MQTLLKGGENLRFLLQDVKEDLINWAGISCYTDEKTRMQSMGLQRVGHD